MGVPQRQQGILMTVEGWPALLDMVRVVDGDGMAEIKMNLAERCTSPTKHVKVDLPVLRYS